MKGCQRFRRDHEAIGELVANLERVLAAQRRGLEVPPTLLAGAVEFFSTLAERCHETMEERVLFPLLVASEIVDQALILMLQQEHEEGRRLLGALRLHCAGPDKPPEVTALLRSYLALERHHLEAEGASVFARMEQKLSASQDAEIEAGCERIEETVLGPGGRGALLALGGALIRTCRTLVADRPPGDVRLTLLDLLRGPEETVGPEDNLSRASEIMDRLGVRELAVVERGALVGILTRTDMEPHRGHLEWTRVRAAMTFDPVTVPPDASIAKVARLLLDRGFNSLPVAADRHLFGLIRRSDLLRVLRDGTPIAA